MGAYRQLLRMVYRMIFLFAAEDRGLLLDPNADPVARERYTRFYSTARLRRLAEKRRGTKHADLYRGLGVVMQRLGSDEGCSALALPALGSFLWREEAVADIAHADIANKHLLEAVRALAFTVENKVFQVVDYKNMGAEELGSIYESLLEMHPEINADAATFELKVAAGHERKTTGSYYTPSRYNSKMPRTIAASQAVHRRFFADSFIMRLSKNCLLDQITQARLTGRDEMDHPGEINNGPTRAGIVA